MGYTDYSYLVVFLLGTFALYYMFPKKARWVVLLLASYLFYYLCTKSYAVVYLLITTVSVYFCALWLDKINGIYALAKKKIPPEEKQSFKQSIKWQKNAVIIPAILLNAGILVYLKYSGFFVNNINLLLHKLPFTFELPIFKLLVPLGISFYTLQAISYIVDVYRAKTHASKEFGKVALYLSFFGGIVEGPISKFDDLADSLYGGNSFSYKNMTFGLQLIFWGLFKKIVIADRANMLVSTVFDHPNNYTGIIIVAAVLMYTLQLYTEFSGAMDIVRGSAQLFGVTLTKNFDHPFFSRSVSEFWRRWHMSLGAWLKDYIFYPVTMSSGMLHLSKKLKSALGSFGTKIPVIAALFLVWLTCGLWHGAQWKYVVYGMYYFCLIVMAMFIEPLAMRLWGVLKVNPKAKMLEGLRIVRTFLFVNLGMLIFRSENLVKAWEYFKAIFAGSFFANRNMLFKIGIDKYDWRVIAGGAVVVLLVSLIEQRGYSLREEISKKNLLVRWCMYFALIFAVIIFGAYGTGYDPVAFIYANF